MAQTRGPHTFEVKFEAGITRREALKVMHRNWLLILRQVEAEAHLDHREELKAAASMAEFRAACKRSIQEYGLDDSDDEHWGVGKTRVAEEQLDARIASIFEEKVRKAKAEAKAINEKAMKARKDEEEKEKRLESIRPETVAKSAIEMMVNKAIIKERQRGNVDMDNPSSSDDGGCIVEAAKDLVEACQKTASPPT